MGRLALVVRLAGRDLRRRGVEVALLLVVLSIASATLTLGLILHGTVDAPYARTRAATRGPDVVVSVFPALNRGLSARQRAAFHALSGAPGVFRHSGPFPVTWAMLRVGSIATGVELEGREPGAVAVDQPMVTAGTWVRRGGVVLERTFADALGAHVGDVVQIAGRSWPVVGIAVTTAFSPYPKMCTGGCILDTPQLRDVKPGLAWLTRGNARAMATSAEPLAYFTNLRLHNPRAAPSFVARHTHSQSIWAPSLESWQDIGHYTGELEQNEQLLLMVGSWLLGLIAIATVVVLVGGRVADQTRRAGLLKAVGATPRLIAAVLLAEYLVIAALSVIVGLVSGMLLAPVLEPAETGLLGGSGSPLLRPVDVLIVAGVTIGITVLATFVPAVRAARISTVKALGESRRSPRRVAALVGLSRYLPTCVLIGLRVAAGRPRRTLLSAFSVAVVVTGIVVVMFAQAKLDSEKAGTATGLPNPDTQRLTQIMLALTMLVVIMGAVNMAFVASLTALDARVSLAVTRALGATPTEAASGLAIVQIIPALLGTAIGWPTGAALFAALNHGGTATAHPPLWWLLALIPSSVLLAVVLTGLASRLSARRSTTEILAATSV